MIVQLVLQGRYSDDGVLLSHGSAKRLVPVALDIKGEREDVKRFFCKEEGCDILGLKAEGAWWRIVEVFECIEPTLDLHEDKYPVSFGMTVNELEVMVEMLNEEEKEKNKEKGNG